MSLARQKITLGSRGGFSLFLRQGQRIRHLDTFFNFALQILVGRLQLRSAGLHQLIKATMDTRILDGNRHRRRQVFQDALASCGKSP